MKGKTKQIIILLFLLLLIPSCNLGKTLPAPILTPSDTPPPLTPLATTTLIAGDLGWGAIHGKVTDATTSAPVVGAKITCDHFSYTSPVPCKGNTFTDNDGNYFFNNIFFHDTDRIHLRVEALGYELKEFEQSFFTFPELISDFALIPTSTIITPVDTPLITCTQPSCGPYDALVCSQGDCPNGCGFICITPVAICTPPLCAIGTSEVYYCSSGACAGGCGTTCATITPAP
jgi:hypothetical protein